MASRRACFVSKAAELLLAPALTSQLDSTGLNSAVGRHLYRSAAIVLTRPAVNHKVALLIRAISSTLVLVLCTKCTLIPCSGFPSSAPERHLWTFPFFPVFFPHTLKLDSNGYAEGPLIYVALRVERSNSVVIRRFSLSMVKSAMWEVAYRTITKKDTFFACTLESARCDVSHMSYVYIHTYFRVWRPEGRC